MIPDRSTRLEARERPTGNPVMFQSWHDLLFIHWAVGPGELEQELPPGLHLDRHDGRAWLGIVPFFMRNVRPRGLPAVPAVSHFLELNVRTYVYDDAGIPGVWFLSLDASNRLACAIARLRFHLPYRDAAMEASRRNGWIDYHALRSGEESPARYRYRGTGGERLAEPDGLEFFLLERYVLYAHEAKGNRLWRGRVHHEPYRIRDAELDGCSLAPLAWDGLVPPPGPPGHSCVSPGVDVEVFKLEQVSAEHPVQQSGHPA